MYTNKNMLLPFYVADRQGLSRQALTLMPLTEQPLSLTVSLQSCPFV